MDFYDWFYSQFGVWHVLSFSLFPSVPFPSQSPNLFSSRARFPVQSSTPILLSDVRRSKPNPTYFPLFSRWCEGMRMLSWMGNFHWRIIIYLWWLSCSYPMFLLFLLRWSSNAWTPLSFSRTTSISSHTLSFKFKSCLKRLSNFPWIGIWCEWFIFNLPYIYSGNMLFPINIQIHIDKYT